MKNDQERENRLKEAVRDALSTVCRKDENGVFYEEIYADYRDTLDDCTLKKICNDDHPHEKFWELLDEWYRDCEWEYADNVIKRVLEDEDVAELIENLDEDEVRELIRDQFYVKYPAKHYLAQNVLIDLIVDTGDLNYDFTSNIIGGHYDASDDSIPEESSLLWLARQQGYKKSELKKTLLYSGDTQSPLLKSIYAETLNCSSHMNALVFLVKMTLEEYFKQQLAETKEFREIGSYWENKKGLEQCEIDIVALKIEKAKAVAIEVKRQRKEFKPDAFAGKVLHLKEKVLSGYEIEARCLSLEDM